jgi:FkbM family methyltransferase
MSFISYAQNFEDVMLWRALKHIETGFYIDVGANDPETHSVTKAFYELGWRGINIEPVPQWFQRLKESRLRDINLQLAAGSKSGEITLFEIPDTGLSTTKKAFADRHEAERGYQSQKVKVPLDTLTNLCEQYHTAPIHFLKIDVEGMEKATLEGMDFSKIRPWIVLVESTLPGSQEECHSEWESMLLDAGYQYTYCDGINRFYVADEHSELLDSFKYPPNVFDGFTLKRHMDAESRAINADHKAQDADARGIRAEAHAEEAEKKAQEAQAVIEKLQPELESTGARVEQLEEQLNGKDRELAEKQSDLGQARAIIEQLQPQLEGTEARVAQLEEHLNGKDCELAAKQSDLEQAQAAIEQLQPQLKGAEAQVAQLEEQLNGKNHELAAKQSDLEQAQAVIEQVQPQLEGAEAQVEQLEEQLSGKDRELAAKQGEFEQLQAHSQWLQNEWNAANAKVDELNHSSHHWWTVADGLNREQQIIYHSKFWRMTWPLRKLMQLFKRLFLFPVCLITGLIRLPKRAARMFVSKSIRFILQREGLKHRIRKWLYRHPKLKAHLRAFARKRGLIPGSIPIPQHPAETEMPTEEGALNALGGTNSLTGNDDLTAALTPRARRIYAELKSAIEKKQRSTG